MVRKYKHKTEQRAYTVDSIVCALRAISLGTSIRAAARDFNIPERTLRDHWNRNHCCEGRSRCIEKVNSFKVSKRRKTTVCYEDDSKDGWDICIIKIQIQMIFSTFFQILHFFLFQLLYSHTILNKNSNKIYKTHLVALF